MKLQSLASLLFVTLALISSCKPSAPTVEKPAEKTTAEPAAPSAPVAEDAKALNKRGLDYEEGNGVTKDLAEAAKYYRQAADLGLAEGQFNLGLCYAGGVGVAEVPAEAAKWYQLAADQGLADAQLNLGVAFDDGVGVTKDPVTAAMWYRLAKQNKQEGAESLLTKLEKSLTPEQMAAVDQRVNAFKPKSAK